MTRDDQNKAKLTVDLNFFSIRMKIKNRGETIHVAMRPRD
jgi:hypothetical protein